MFQVELREGDRMGRDGFGSRRLLVLFATAVVVLAGSGFGRCGIALAQQAKSSNTPKGSDTSKGSDINDVQGRTREIVANLNAVIQYYRSTTQPIQKAGQPNDVVYRDQATTLSSQIAGFAFQSAKAQAALMAKYEGAKAAASSSSGPGEQQKMQATEADAEQRITDIKARQVALDKQIATAKPKDVAALRTQKQQLQGALDLANAIKDALQKIVGMSGAAGATGLVADIDRLQSSVPELASKNKTTSPLLITIASARSSGVTSQGTVLIDLLETRHSLSDLLDENEHLDKQALDLRTPLVAVLRTLIQQGQQMSEQALQPAQPQPAQPVQPAPVATDKGKDKNVPAAAAPPSGQPNIASITTEFKVLSAATIPLSQEIIVVEQSRANLLAWQTSVDQEYDSILHAILLRICVIVIALVLILGGGEVWRHATNKYVQDIRRRRQLLIVRRVVVGLLSVIVVLFGFVTQFNSLATFAGFITAGIAVGLQTILLSVAAYFFIIGRYGIKVGDRITIATVTGDVIDVGLVRFYMMELAGSGQSLNPTGRVAVFSNAVLFQAGTPLYKQIPGTGYAWHELIVKLADSANYKLVCESVLKEVHGVYEEHRVAIERQHKGVEDQMQIPIDLPAVESRLQFNAGAFQVWVRFPVEIDHAAVMDEKLTEALVDLFAKNPEIKSGVASTPVIQPSVKG